MESGAGRLALLRWTLRKPRSEHVREHVEARLADGEVEMPKEECRWIEEREEDPMAEGGRVFGVWDWRCRWRLPLAGGG